MKQRTGCYLKSNNPPTREEFERAEQRTFRGATVQGVAVSSYHYHLVFGVVMRTPRGKKLLSKHATIEGAMRAAESREPESQSTPHSVPPETLDREARGK